MPRTREEILRERRQLKAHYGLLFDSVTALLLGTTQLESRSTTRTSANTKVRRVPSCQDSEIANLRLLRAIHEEFVRSFGADTAGPVERYEEIASEIWQL